jgi:hypothetical protein
MMSGQPRWNRGLFVARVLAIGFLIAIGILVTACHVLRCGGSDRLSHADMNKLGLSTVITEPCSPPCWQGLIPLESTQQDVQEVLSHSPFVAVESIRSKIGVINDTPVTYIYWDEALWDHGWFSFIIIDEDGRFLFASILLQYELTLQELIDSLGQPDHYLRIPVGEEVDCEYGRMLWPEQGFAVDTNCVPRARPIFPEILIDFIAYYPPGPDENSYMIARWGRPDNAPFAKWKGFDQQ